MLTSAPCCSPARRVAPLSRDDRSSVRKRNVIGRRSAELPTDDKPAAMPAMASIRPVWMLMLMCARTAESRACSSDDVAFPKVTNTWSLREGQSVVSAAMTIDVQVESNACLVTRAFKSIAHRPVQAKSVRVTGGFSGTVPRAVTHRVYEDNGWTMLEVQFGRSLFVGETFHIRAEYELSSPLCAVERGVVRFHEDWTHKWRVPGNVGVLEYTLCSAHGARSPTLRSSGFGPGSSQRTGCLHWQRNAPVSGAEFELVLPQGQSVPLGMRSCGYVHPELIAIIVAAVSLVIGGIVAAAYYRIHSRCPACLTPWRRKATATAQPPPPAYDEAMRARAAPSARAPPPYAHPGAAVGYAASTYSINPRITAD